MTDVGDRLEATADRLRIVLPEGALGQLERYVDEILRWRRRLNLVSEGIAAEIVDRHITASLLPLTVLDVPEQSRVVDVGSGAGFPGVPLRIARPDLSVTLVEASRRRVAFLEHVCQSLGLADVRIEWGRAEELGHRAALRERFGVATERAAAKLPAAAEMCLPFVEVGGVAVLLKGPSVAAEVGRATALIAALGGRLDRLHRLTAPGTDRVHVLAEIRKTGPTPSDFPRRAGLLGAPP